MRDDYAGLRQLNVEIGYAETRGDTAFFEDLLAPVFAMRRAGRTSRLSGPELHCADCRRLAYPRQLSVDRVSREDE
jgi:hypothetical protein